MPDPRSGYDGSGNQVRIWLGFGLILLGFALMPRILSPYVLILLCYALIFALACLGLNLLLGAGGLYIPRLTILGVLYPPGDFP